MSLVHSSPIIAWDEVTSDGRDGANKMLLPCYDCQSSFCINSCDIHCINFIFHFVSSSRNLIVHYWNMKLSYASFYNLKFPHLMQRLTVMCTCTNTLFFLPLLIQSLPNFLPHQWARRAAEKSLIKNINRARNKTESSGTQLLPGKEEIKSHSQ